MGAIDVSESLIEIVPVAETIMSEDPAFCIYGKSRLLRGREERTPQAVEKRFGDLPLLIPKSLRQEKAVLKVEDTRACTHFESSLR